MNIEKRNNTDITRRTVLAGGAAASVGGLFWIASSSAPAQDSGAEPLQVDVEAIGPPQTELDEVARALRSGEALGPARRSNNLRVISVRAVDPDETGGGQPRWRAIVYDYSAQRALMAEGRLGDRMPDRIEVLAYQPIPSPDEWDEARDRLLRDSEIGPKLRSGDVVAYRPMPPTIVGSTGRRLLTVGLLPRRPGGGVENEIVSVDLADGTVGRFAALAPAASLAGPGICGAPPGAFQQVTGQGVQGSYNVVIRRGATVYWSFTAIRPSASSGRRGSGIELQNVVYRGRKVLQRAHLPILNVKYAGDACGPYRDWQYSEGMLRANGTNVAPGFRRTTTAPTTIIQSGTDVGNFLGTAVWISGEEVTLMAELEAGWYRYISQWTLHTNGTIRPRFGFAAVQNSCVCNIHYHHAYWRFHFDVGGGGNDFAQQLVGGSWREMSLEARALRDAALTRRWRVGGRVGPRYEIRPTASDGRAQASPDWPFGSGDLWFLRYRPNEIDDGVNTTTGAVAARLDTFVNRESIAGTQIVVWYGAHHTHDSEDLEAGAHGVVVGPNLLPVSW